MSKSTSELAIVLGNGNVSVPGDAKRACWGLYRRGEEVDGASALMSAGQKCKV